MLYKSNKKNKKVLVAGCGRFGSCLASSLCLSGYDVTIIDKDATAFHRLSDTFGGFEIHGDATDLQFLEAAGIEESSMVLVATDSDNVNSMIAQIASMIYNVDQVYIRLNDPGKEALLEHTNIKAIYPARLSLLEFENISHIQLSGVKGL